jgi:hypothetical protein
VYRGLAAGAVAGLVGTWAMSEVQRLWTNGVDAIRLRQPVANMMRAMGKNEPSIRTRMSWRPRRPVASSVS